MIRFSNDDITEILMNKHLNRVSLAIAASEVLGREVTQEEWVQLDRDIGARWDGWIRMRRQIRKKFVPET